MFTSSTSLMIFNCSSTSCFKRSVSSLTALFLVGGLECWPPLLSVPAPSSGPSEACVPPPESVALPRLSFLCRRWLSLVPWIKADPAHLVLTQRALSLFLPLPRVVAELFTVYGEFCVRISCPSPNSNRSLLCMWCRMLGPSRFLPFSKWITARYCFL